MLTPPPPQFGSRTLSSCSYHVLCPFVMHASEYLSMPPFSGKCPVPPDRRRSERLLLASSFLRNYRPVDVVSFKRDFRKNKRHSASSEPGLITLKLYCGGPLNVHLVQGRLTLHLALLKRLFHMLALAVAIHALQEERKCQTGRVSGQRCAGLEQPLQLFVSCFATDASFDHVTIDRFCARYLVDTHVST